MRLFRAVAFLRTDQFDASLRDLEILTSQTEPLEKALYHKSQVLYQLHMFAHSYYTGKLLCDKLPDHVSTSGKLERVVARCFEQRRARYQFKQLQEEASQRRPPLLDRATYSRFVKVKDSEDCRGRGLFTTEAVKAGDLLFCEKAFAYAFHDTKVNDKPLSVLINRETEKMVKGTQVELIRMIVQKVYKNPSLLPTLTDLYHGSYESVDVTEVDGRPVVDT